MTDDAYKTLERGLSKERDDGLNLTVAIVRCRLYQRECLAPERVANPGEAILSWDGVRECLVTEPARQAGRMLARVRLAEYPGSVVFNGPTLEWIRHKYPRPGDQWIFRPIPSPRTAGSPGSSMRGLAAGVFSHAGSD